VLHRGRHGRRHRHRRGARHRQGGARQGHPHRRRRHQAVRFEGNRRARSADAGIDELQQHVDTLIVIPNQNLFRIANPNTTFKEAFQMADEVLQQGVRGITDLMVMPGLINLDFADVRSVMGEMGKAMMGTGEASGDNRAIEAAEQAIANPLLDGVSMKGAKGVIISITGGEDMRLMEVDEAANHIKELVDPTPTSSGARRSTTTWKARSASRSSRPASMPSRCRACRPGQGVRLPGLPARRAKAAEAAAAPGADQGADCGSGPGRAAPQPAPSRRSKSPQPGADLKVRPSRSSSAPTISFDDE
jgi:cell division protein FtsZ